MESKVAVILTLLSIGLLFAGCLKKESVVTDFTQSLVAGDFVKASEFGAYPYDGSYDSEDSRKKAMTTWAAALEQLKSAGTYIESLNVTKAAEEDSKLLAVGEVVIVDGDNRIETEATVYLSLIQGLGWKVIKVAIDTKNVPADSAAVKLAAAMNGRF